MAMNFELYTGGDSFLYKIDPRVKIIGVLIVFGISVLFTHPFFLGPFFFLVFMLNIFGKVPFKQVMILLKSLSLLVLISLIMWPLLYHPGNEVFRIGQSNIYFTDLGILYGFGMAFRILNMVIAPITLMLTTSQQDLILGLQGIGLPKKGSFALATTFRFVPTVVGVGNSIIEAQRSRGLDINEGNIFKRMGRYSAVLGPLMINSLRTAQQLALAVETKALGSTAKKTSLKTLRFTSMDKKVLFGFGALIIAVIVIKVLGFGSFQF